MEWKCSVSEDENQLALATGSSWILAKMIYTVNKATSQCSGLGQTVNGKEN